MFSMYQNHTAWPRNPTSKQPSAETRRHCPDVLFLQPSVAQLGHLLEKRMGYTINRRGSSSLWRKKSLSGTRRSKMLKLGDQHRGLQGQRCSGSDPGPTKALALHWEVTKHRLPVSGAGHLSPSTRSRFCLVLFKVGACLWANPMCPSGQGLVSENGPSGPWPGLLPGEYGRHTLALPLGLAWPAGLPGKAPWAWIGLIQISNVLWHVMSPRHLQSLWNSIFCTPKW